MEHLAIEAERARLRLALLEQLEWFFGFASGYLAREGLSDKVPPGMRQASERAYSILLQLRDLERREVKIGT